jgi:hypothetical protein
MAEHKHAMKTECQRHPGMCASDPLCADHYCPGHPRNNRGFIQGNSSASKPGAHMPITFEGDEPQAATPWELMLAGARWVLLAFAFVCTLMIAAGYHGA